MCIRNATIVRDDDGNLRIFGGDRCPLYHLCHESRIPVLVSCHDILERFGDGVPTVQQFSRVVTRLAVVDGLGSGRPRKMMEKRTCPVCGKEFVPKGTTQKYCGIECKNRVYYQPREPQRRVCVVCGKVFVAKGTGSTGQKYCGKECIKAAAREARKRWVMKNPDYQKEYAHNHKEMRREHMRRYRAKKKKKLMEELGI